MKLERVDSKHPMLLYEAGTCPSLDADCGDAGSNGRNSQIHPGSGWVVIGLPVGDGNELDHI